MSEERNHEATPKKLRDARRRGEVWQSRELGTACILISSGIAFGALGGEVVAALRTSFELALAMISGQRPMLPGALLEASLSLVMQAMLPIAAVLVIAAALAGGLQVGPLFSTEVVSWKTQRLDPMAGMGRLFSLRRAVDLMRSTIAIAAVFAVALTTLREELRGIVSLPQRDPQAILVAVAVLIRALLLRAGGLMLALAVVDVVFQRWQYLRDQRMTRREVEREQRESDGDPHIKRARDRVRKELANHSALESARTATLLVHGARDLVIAIRFDESAEDALPEVIAKGRDALGRRMLAVAYAEEIQITEDAALAASLDELTPGEHIRPAHYEAIALLIRGGFHLRVPQTMKPG